MAAMLGAKVFHDPVHDTIKIPLPCVKIINTPQFQRLRNIKQMGGVDFVFQGACHNRLEHSIGTCYVAGEMVRHLQTNQPELGISEVDVLCVMLAGLCHDLGHGPFSHMFDSRFIPEARPGYDWKHEKASVDMFNHMVKENNIIQIFCDKRHGWDKATIDRDFEFIREMIEGVSFTRGEWSCTGRDKEKSYLYQIISNKSNGLDVDKFDYFARDCYHLGFNNSFEYRRLIEFCKVLKVDGFNQICFRDKVGMNLYDMYHVRTTIHRRACKHRVTQVVEIMFCEAFLKAEDDMRIEGEGGQEIKLSESIKDMVAYTKVTDDIVQKIKWSDSTNKKSLKEAQDLLKRIDERDFYSFVGQARPKPVTVIQKDDRIKLLEVFAGGPVDGTTPIPTITDNLELGEDKIKILQNILGKTFDGEVPILKDEDKEKHLKDIADGEKKLEGKLVLDIIKLDYGMKDKNPIDNVWFYTKEDPEKPIRITKEMASDILPAKFHEQRVRLYCKTRDILAMAKMKFEQWCEKEGLAHCIVDCL